MADCLAAATVLALFALVCWPLLFPEAEVPFPEAPPDPTLAPPLPPPPPPWAKTGEAHATRATRAIAIFEAMTVSPRQFEKTNAADAFGSAPVQRMSSIGLCSGTGFATGMAGIRMQRRLSAGTANSESDSLWPKNSEPLNGNRI
jgi:hypothetical protein